MPSTIVQMRYTRRRRTFGVAAILMLLGALMLGLTAQAAMRFVIGDALPSGPPALLAPITEDGRVGWKCAAERAARAAAVRDADLPDAEY